MKCNQCGFDTDVSEWKFCPSCGKSLRDEKFIRYLFLFFKSKKNVGFFLIGLFILMGFIFWGFYRKNLEIAQKNRELEEYVIRQSNIGVEWTAKDKIIPLIAEEEGYLGKLKVSSQQHAQLSVEIEAEGITEKKFETLSVKPDTVSIEIGAAISDDGYQKLKLGGQRTKVRIKVFQIISDNKKKLLLENERELFFYSIYDMLWEKDGVKNTGKALRLVNKDDPSVSEMVHKSAKYVKEFGGTENVMLGYSSDNKKEIEAQIKALFKTMKEDYELRYIMSPFSYSGLDVQEIKNPEQVLSTKSGICIDFSLLMVAVFENLGFDPVLVFTKNHVWPGIEIGYRSENYIFIESTALDKSPSEAISIAEKNWKNIQDKNNLENFDLVRIVDVRSEGVLPIF